MRLLCCVSWTANALFFFGIWLPLCSPVSLRAFLCQDPFMSDFELSQVNGTVCPSKGSLTATLSSRLQRLWRHISKARSHFEATPDTGFIGKGVTRHANRLWNYVVKGLLGTLLLTMLFPVTCVVASLGSTAVAVTAPLWVPVVVLGVQLASVLVYDMDCPVHGGAQLPPPVAQLPSQLPHARWFPVVQAVGLHVCLLGLLQPLVALLTAALVCPFAAAIVVAYAAARRVVRAGWDAAMFHCVIKKRGRVPASDRLFAQQKWIFN